MMRRLAVNTASNVGTLFIKLSITFVMTPIFIKNLGHYDYGVWEMIGAFIGYMGILDLGIRPAVSRFAARHIAQNDQKQLTLLYATAWIYLFIVGLFISTILVCWGLFFPEILAENSTDTQRYTLLMLILGAQLFLVFPSYTVESYMEAYQEYYLKNNLTIINSIIGCIVVFIFINPANALILVAGVNAIGLIIKYMFYTFYMQYKRPFLRIRWKYFSFAKLKELFKFSIKTVIQGVSGRIENATDSLVIGAILGPATVPIYSVPAHLASYIRKISYNLTHVFMPYFSALHATNENEKIRRVYVFGSKLTIGCVLILSIGAVGLGEPFLYLWVGSEIASGAAPIIFLLVAFTVVPLINPYCSRYLTAIDRHGIFAKWSPVVALANLILSIILIYPLGIYGVALGSLIPSLIFQPFLLNYCCRHLGMKVSEYLKGAIMPMLLPAVLMTIILVVVRLNYVIDSYRMLLSVATGASLVFCGAAIFTGLTSAERKQLLGIVLKR